VDLLQVPLCLQNAPHLATQEGSLMQEANTSLVEGFSLGNFIVKLRPIRQKYQREKAEQSCQVCKRWALPLLASEKVPEGM
jgi:hypothetical protein